MSQTADRNLLFGILAVQNDFITIKTLVSSLNIWILDKSRSIEEILVERGFIDQAACDVLERMVAYRIECQQGDTARSLGRLSSVESIQESLGLIADTDIQASLQRIPPGHSIPKTGPALDDSTVTHTPDHDASTASFDPGTGDARASGSRARESEPRFRRIKLHAKGGLGEIFLAEDGELNRRVALKEIQDHHADHLESRSRFIIEAEITGGLEHPGIVPVYGLGRYADGRPFYAMRFIQGDSLADAIKSFHADPTLKTDPGRRTLALQKLLRRFLDVCNAVAYAHSRGVLHRDLKPGNVMVGKYGETLVVDWGLAKVLGNSETPVGGEPPLVPMSGSGLMETLGGAVLGTPAYMPPEQAEGRIDELGPASDVYSLGATLYHLLTNQRPVRGESAKAILDAVIRGEISKPHSIDPSIPKGLDAVCLKAMAKRIEDRYATPLDLAADIEHWLADEPVLALPEGPSQKLARWGRRHRAWVQSGVAALALISVMAFTALAVVDAARRSEARQKLAAMDAERRTVIQRDKAIAAEAEARSEAAKSKAINEFLANDLLNQAEPDENAFEDKVTLQEVLDRAAIKVGDRFKDQPEIEASLRETIARTYQGLAFWEKSENQWKALEEAARRRNPNSSETYRFQSELSHLLIHRGRRDAEIEMMAKSAVDGLARTLGPNHPSTLVGLSHLAHVYRDLGRSTESIALYEQVRDGQLKNFGPENVNTLAAINNLAAAYQDDDRNKEAIALLEQVRDAELKTLGPTHPKILTTLSNLALAYQQSGRLKEAIALLEQVRDSQAKRLGAEHDNTLVVLNNLAVVYGDAGRPKEAIAILEQARDVQVKTLGATHQETLTTLGNLGKFYRLGGRMKEGIALLEQVRDTLPASLRPDHPMRLAAMSNLGEAYYASRRLKEAITMYEQVRELQAKTLAVDHPKRLSVLLNLASVYGEAGMSNEAVALLTQVRDVVVPKFGDDHKLTISARAKLATAYMEVGRRDEAVALYEQAKVAQIKTLGAEHADTLTTLNNLATTYWSMKQLDKSIPLFEDVLKRTEAKFGRQHPDTQATLANLGVNYKDAGRLADSIAPLEEAYRAGKTDPSLRWVGAQLLDAYSLTGRTAESSKLARELVADVRKTSPEGGPPVGDILAACTLPLLRLKAFAEVEPLLRECLAIRKKHAPEDWRTFNTQSMLGEVLLEQKKYTDAEPLLVGGYEGMKQRANAIPPLAKIRIPEAQARLIRLYEATDRKDAAAKLRNEPQTNPSQRP